MSNNFNNRSINSFYSPTGSTSNPQNTFGSNTSNSNTMYNQSSPGGFSGSTFQSNNITGQNTAGFGNTDSNKQLLNPTSTSGFSSNFMSKPMSGGFGSQNVSSNFGNTSLNTSGFGAKPESGFGSNIQNKDNKLYFPPNNQNNSSGFLNNNIGGFNNNQNTGFGMNSNIQTASSFGQSTSGFGQSTNQGSFGTVTGGFNTLKPPEFANSSGNFGSSNFGNTTTSSLNTTGSFGFGNNQKGFQKYGPSAFQPKSLELGDCKNPNNDYEFPDVPVDTITDISFNDKNNYCIVTSWDRTVSCYNIDVNRSQVNLGYRFKLQDGISFDASWNREGNCAFLACSDQTVKIWDLNNQSMNNFKTFNSVVKCVRFINSGLFSGLAVGLWDKRVLVFDQRSPEPIYSYNSNDKFIQFDSWENHLIALTTGKTISYYKLSRSRQNPRSITIDPKYQFRSLCFTFSKMNKEPSGFAIGSVDGRINLINTEGSVSSPNIVNIKAHRLPCQDGKIGKAFPVNCLLFLKNKQTLISGGADGIISFWNKASRNKLKSLNQCNLPITTLNTNLNEDYIVYSTGYDWSRGYEYFDIASMKPSIFLRTLNNDIK